jgi:hypothetical protein
MQTARSKGGSRGVRSAPREIRDSTPQVAQQTLCCLSLLVCQQPDAIKPYANSIVPLVVSGGRQEKGGWLGWPSACMQRASESWTAGRKGPTSSPIQATGHLIEAIGKYWRDIRAVGRVPNYRNSA